MSVMSELWMGVDWLTFNTATYSVTSLETRYFGAYGDDFAGDVAAQDAGEVGPEDAEFLDAGVDLATTSNEKVGRLEREGEGLTGLMAHARLRITRLRGPGVGVGAESTLKGWACLAVSQAARLVSVDIVIGGAKSGRTSWSS